MEPKVQAREVRRRVGSLDCGVHFDPPWQEIFAIGALLIVNEGERQHAPKPSPASAEHRYAP